MPQIDYSQIPFKEKRSTGEHVECNAFYMPKITQETCHHICMGVGIFGVEFPQEVEESEREE